MVGNFLVCSDRVTFNCRVQSRKDKLRWQSTCLVDCIRCGVALEYHGPLEVVVDMNDVDHNDSNSGSEIIQLLLWTVRANPIVRFLFDKAPEQIVKGIEFQQRQIEANKYNNQQNVPQLGNKFEAWEILKLQPEVTNVMLVFGKIGMRGDYAIIEVFNVDNNRTRLLVWL